MTINKNLYSDVQDGQTNGSQAAALVNDNKRAVNDVVDYINTFDAERGTAAVQDMATDGEVVAGGVGKVPDAKQLRDNFTITRHSVAECKALTGMVAGQSVNLVDEGRSGIFDVKTGDFTAEVAADTLNGVHIAMADDPTGATKCLVRRLNGFVTPEMFGGDIVVADSSIVSGGASKVVDTDDLRLLPGFFTAGQAVKKANRWVGSGAENTRITYSGAAAIDWITQDLIVGRNAVGGIYDITLNGTDCGSILRVPENASGAGADDRYKIERVHFIGGERQIELDGWVNFNQSGNRHDNWSDAAIVLTSSDDQFLRNWSYSNFTADTNINDGSGYVDLQPDCFCRIDISAVTGGNIGKVKFENARIEINRVAMSGVKSIFSTIATAGNQVNIILDGIEVQASSSGWVDSLFYRSQGGTLTTERYSGRNVMLNNVGAMFAGDFPTWMLSIPTGNWLWFECDSINGFVGQRTNTSGVTGVIECYGPASNTPIMQVYAPGKLHAGLHIRPDVHMGGDGNSAPSVLLRHAGKTGWSLPTVGYIDRTLSEYVAGTASGSYTQAELQDVMNQLQDVTKTLAAVIYDLHSSGTGSHGLFRS